MSIERKITVASGAGLIGQDLIPRLTARGYTCIVATDKHPANTATLARVNPGVEVIKADLARPGSWETALIGADTLDLNHAQIGALEEKPFLDDNVHASAKFIAATQHASVPHVVHVSSSVVNAKAHDF